MTALIQKLHMKWLWLKWSWSFRWAHKPLCERFHKDVLQLGRLHVCRSCVCIYSGMLLGVVAFLVAPASPTLAWCTGVGMLLPLGLSYPRWYRYWSRTTRDVLRFSAGFCCVLTFVLTATIHLLAGAILAALIASCWLLFFRVRGGLKSSACDGCPELGCRGVCPGYQLQAELIRSYEDEASDLLARSLSDRSMPDRMT